jgi:hypothetical protein
MTAQPVGGYASGMKDIPSSYQIRVQDHVDPTLAEWLAPLSIVNHPNGKATLAGRVRDQAELYGLLLKLAHLNFRLIAVQRMPGSARQLGVPHE